MKRIAVITGASSGLGAEFLKYIPAIYPQIQEIWTVQRRKVTVAECILPVKNIQLDLADNQSFNEFEKLLQAEHPEIQLLINNAGFGKIGNFLASDYHEQGRMIDLNNRAATLMTALCLPYMQCGGSILHVSSIASFAPNPGMAVYSSTKAYLLSFSRALREELKPQGIHCMAVCPGPMHTEFLPVAGIVKGKSKAFDRLPYCDPSAVALKALKKAQRGCAVYTPKLFYKFYRVLAKLLPHHLVMKFSKTL